MRLICTKVGKTLFAAALIALLWLVSAAQVQSGGGYTLSWWTVDGGGTTFDTGGSYTLGSTIGQPDANVWQGGEYTLTGGFWGSRGVAAKHRIYLPLILR